MKNDSPEKLDPKKYIIIKGARVHNLKNLTVAIPRNTLTVITGVSGSGKSSLAFDTLYAEGQRRYVESLSSYARQFMGRMNKPNVEYIRGISPAIAIEQKVNTRNPRSTVGTATEIYDYLKLLFARIGKTFSPLTGLQVKRHSVTDVVNYINRYPDGTPVQLFAPCKKRYERTLAEELNILLQKGFTRIRYNDKVQKIEDLLASEPPKTKQSVPVKPSRPGKELVPQVVFSILVDRVTVQKNDDENTARISDSVQTAFDEGNGACTVEAVNADGASVLTDFSGRFESDGMPFEEPSVHLFSFNNPYGACKTCEGFGHVIGIDEDLVVPDKSLSVYDQAIACWRGEKMKKWNEKLIKHSLKFDFPIHRPFYQLTTEEKKLLWTGNNYFDGIDDFFRYVESQSHKIQYRVMMSRYRGKTSCPECLGSRLRRDASYVMVAGQSITNLVLMPVNKLLPFFKNIVLDKQDQQVAKRILAEIVNRLQYLEDVGLGYLTLNRLSNSLSGGESQRINLATSLGSSLVGSMYILDEPSIGLHPRDTERLVHVLKSLRNLGNTVIVVEHEEEVIRAADQVIDIGPLAGSHGGELIFQGGYEELLKDETSLTARYINGKEEILIPSRRRKWKYAIQVTGARENNLDNLSVKFPLGVMTVVTGVSGSGKTSLVKKVLYTALKKMYGGYGEQSGAFDAISGDTQLVHAVELVDQNPIGKSSRSNPVTYVKAYDEIRSLYSELPLSRTRRYKPSHFSFNVDGGRCDTCQGEGEITIEMQFMADVHLVCESCSGKRFKDEVLEVQYKEKNIADILDLTVDEAILFFSDEERYGLGKKIIAKLTPLAEVGLGYIRLGQSSSTLSGGEAQRIKLAYYLGKGNTQEKTLFVFDEPTTGLHFHDIKKLLHSFNALLALGHTVLIIEHNPEVIKCADWVIDLGPEGGAGGGKIIFEGIPEELVKYKGSHTGNFLRKKIVPFMSSTK